MSEDKSRTIKALLKRAQSDVHGAQSDRFREMAKRRAILLRGAQRKVERGQDPQVEFGEGYGDSTPTSFGPFKGHEAKQAGKDRHGFVVYDLFKDGEKVSGGHTSREIEKKMDQLKTESYLGKMDSLGKKIGKISRRLSKMDD